jgi:long-chain acyl-CoA synthetase
VLLTAEDEELTPTMKLKRSFVSDKYGAMINSMYAS